MEDNNNILYSLNLSAQREAVSNYYAENYKEVRKGRYISAGWDNNHFIMINSLLQKSAVHSACVNAKIDMITANGINYNKDNKELQKLVDNIYSTDYLTEIIDKCAADAVGKNGYALMITLGTNKKIFKIEHLELENLRYAYNKTEILYSPDWQSNSNRIAYPKFEFNGEHQTSILYVDLTKNNNFYYPVPEYFSSYDYILTEEYISLFQRNNANNGWYPSFHLHISKNVPLEQRPKVANELKNSYQGVKKGNTLFLTFGDPGAEPPKLEPINSNSNDEKFLQLLSKCEEKILQAHQMSSPALAGISMGSNSVISNGEEITNLTNIFNQIYIKPKQKAILKAFNRLLKFNGILEDEITFNEFQFNFNEKIDLTNTKTILDSTYNEESKKILLANEGYTQDQIDVLLTNTSVADIPTAAATIEQASDTPVANDVLTNLTGRQMQNLMRITNKYNKGQLTREQAIMMITSAYNLTEDQANLFISNEENNTEA